MVDFRFLSILAGRSAEVPLTLTEFVEVLREGAALTAEQAEVYAVRLRELVPAAQRGHLALLRDTFDAGWQDRGLHDYWGPLAPHVLEPAHASRGLRLIGLPFNSAVIYINERFQELLERYESAYEVGSLESPDATLAQMLALARDLTNLDHDLVGMNEGSRLAIIWELLAQVDARLAEGGVKALESVVGRKGANYYQDVLEWLDERHLDPMGQRALAIRDGRVHHLAFFTGQGADYLPDLEELLTHPQVFKLYEQLKPLLLDQGIDVEALRPLKNADPNELTTYYALNRAGTSFAMIALVQALRLYRMELAGYDFRSYAALSGQSAGLLPALLAAGAFDEPSQRITDLAVGRIDYFGTHHRDAFERYLKLACFIGARYEAEFPSPHPESLIPGAKLVPPPWIGQDASGKPVSVQPTSGAIDDFFLSQGLVNMSISGVPYEPHEESPLQTIMDAINQRNPGERFSLRVSNQQVAETDRPDKQHFNFVIGESSALAELAKMLILHRAEGYPEAIQGLVAPLKGRPGVKAPIVYTRVTIAPHNPDIFTDEVLDQLLVQARVQGIAMYPFDTRVIANDRPDNMADINNGVGLLRATLRQIMSAPVNIPSVVGEAWVINGVSAIDAMGPSTYHAKTILPLLVDLAQMDIVGASDPSGGRRLLSTDPRVAHDTRIVAATAFPSASESSPASEESLVSERSPASAMSPDPDRVVSLTELFWDELGDHPWVGGLVSALQMGPYNEAHAVQFMMEAIAQAALRIGAVQTVAAGDRISTPYLNTIPVAEQAQRDGNVEVENRIENTVRWNAAILVDRANRRNKGLGGHIATYQSAATLYEVAFNHFFQGDDQVFFQGHASPGIYARAFLEGRLTRDQLEHFRREVEGKGLPSYPHPWTMPEFWQFATVSMGLGPLAAIYQASFNRYVQNRGNGEVGNKKVWAFLGDGEMDEPESTSGLSFAAREGLDNLIFVVNANLQSLDRPVRGNGSIIQELERTHAAAGWNVIKVVWGSLWDPLFARDTQGLILKRMGELNDGDWQAFASLNGAEIRQRFCQQRHFESISGHPQDTSSHPEPSEGSPDPTLLALFTHLNDAQLKALFDNRGGHDPAKVYAAYQHAVSLNNGKPTVIIAQSIKGRDLSVGAGVMGAHNRKGLDAAEVYALNKNLGMNVDLPDSTDKDGVEVFLKEQDLFVELSAADRDYMLERRHTLGGFLPKRRTQTITHLVIPEPGYLVEKYRQGSATAALSTAEYVRLLLQSMEEHAERLTLLRGEGQGVQTITARARSTTMMIRDIIVDLSRLPGFGERVVPIIPDEGRTFGWDGMMKTMRVYDPHGHAFTLAKPGSPVDYTQAVDGQIIETGINEAGAMAMFLAAATSYATHGIPHLPFYNFYSMFGLQRTMDSWWQTADMRGRGFLIGATHGRTTLNGEGLQHEDGHSLLLASAIPNLISYDPAFGYEMAVIVEDGIRRMYGQNEDVFYYITAQNENYFQPTMPAQDGVREGILKGMYLFAAGSDAFPSASEGSPEQALEIPRSTRNDNAGTWNDTSRSQKPAILASGSIMQEALRAQQILAREHGILVDVFSVTSYTELAREAEAVDHWNKLNKTSGGLRTPYVSQVLADPDRYIVAVSDNVRAVPNQIRKWAGRHYSILGTDGFGMSDTREALRAHFEVNAESIVQQLLYDIDDHDHHPANPARSRPLVTGTLLVRADHHESGSPDTGPVVEGNAVHLVITDRDEGARSREPQLRIISHQAGDQDLEMIDVPTSHASQLRHPTLMRRGARVPGGVRHLTKLIR